MKNIIKIASGIALSLSLIACSEKVKTVEYYENHDEERESVVKECKNNAQLMRGANCKNAMKVHMMIMLIGKRGEEIKPMNVKPRYFFDE